MSDAIFYREPYRTELECRITAVDGEWIELDATLFYPEGGGQPGDCGSLSTERAQWAVIDTRKGEQPGVIRHRLASAEHDLQVGEVVQQRLDWTRRYKHMRMHTSLHLLCSLITHGVTGGAVSADKGRLDFDLGESSAPDKAELEQRLNALIQGEYPVLCCEIDESMLEANPELVRTMSVQPPRGRGVVRMVQIQGVDFQPCGGTHVANTREIGALRVAKIESKGKRNRRVILTFAEDSPC